MKDLQMRFCDREENNYIFNRHSVVIKWSFYCQ